MKDKVVDELYNLILDAQEEVELRENIHTRIYASDRKKLAQKIRDSLVIDKDYLKDIIYCTTQHLELPDKDVALLNRCLSDAILRANLIKVKP